MNKASTHMQVSHLLLSLLLLRSIDLRVLKLKKFKTRLEWLRVDFIFSRKGQIIIIIIIIISSPRVDGRLTRLTCAVRLSSVGRL